MLMSQAMPPLASATAWTSWTIAWASTEPDDIARIDSLTTTLTTTHWK
ncbi:hypothetical protein [Streptomyces sp. NPDC058632]